MEVEADINRARNVTVDHRSHRSWSWWTSVVAIGVFVGNLISFGVYQLYVEWELRKALVVVERMIERQAESSRETIEKLARENQARVQRQQEVAATMAQLRKTCDYWTKVVRTENTPLNREYKQMACARVRGFSY